MLFNEGGMQGDTITEWPSRPLHHAVFVVHKKMKQLIKSLLIVANPFNDLIAIGFGMFFQNLVA